MIPQQAQRHFSVGLRAVNVMHGFGDQGFSLPWRVCFMVKTGKPKVQVTSVALLEAGLSTLQDLSSQELAAGLKTLKLPNSASCQDSSTHSGISVSFAGTFQRLQRNSARVEVWKRSN